MSGTAISAEDLGKRYVLGAREQSFPGSLRESISQSAAQLIRGFRKGSNKSKTQTFWALRNATFEIACGKVTGVIGRNGAGKSTLLKILSRVTAPTEGTARIVGRVASLLEVGTGFHPELTGRENIFLNAAVMGMRRSWATRRFNEIVAFAEIERHLDTAVKHYSSGMYVRLAFAIAAHLEPEVLIVDEVLAVGDYAFQRKCLGRINEIGREGRTVLVVSHSMQTVVNLCERAILLEDGQVSMDGSASSVVHAYLARGHLGGPSAVWPDPASAPGDSKVRLHSIQACTADGRPATELDSSKEIAIRISYWCLRDDQPLTPGFHLTNEMGIRILEATNGPGGSSTVDPKYGVPLSRGFYRAECRIPANLLNEGSYRIDVGFYEAGLLPGGTLESFRVYDPPARKKPDNRAWEGVVHPLMGWSTTAQVDPRPANGRENAFVESSPGGARA